MRVIRETFLPIIMLSAALLTCAPAPAHASPVTLQVTDADVRSTMLSLARMADLSLVFDATVSGSVTVSITDEPESILRYIAKTNGLLLVEEGNVFLVTRPDRAGSMSSLHTYEIRYADPDDLARTLNLSFPLEGKSEKSTNNKRSDRKRAPQSDGEKGTVEREKTASAAPRIRVDRATNTLLFYGTDSEAEELKKVLEKLDVPAKQVSLEAKVVALSREASKSLGIEWDWSTLPRLPERSASIYRRGTDSESSDVRVDRDFNGKGYTPGVITFGHGPGGQPFEFYYEARLNALVTDGKAEILARPNITTVQGREAVISIGGDVPIPQETIANDVSRMTYRYKKAGIILRCTPRVNEDGSVTADVHTEVSTPYYVDAMNAYRFQNRSADTTVRLADGETMVIGGLIGKEETRHLRKVPLLGDIPIIGALFRSITKSKEDTEVTIFLTARVVR